MVIGKHMFLIIVLWYAVRPAADGFLSHIAAFFLSPSLAYAQTYLHTAERKLDRKDDFQSLYLDECGKASWPETWKKVSD